MITWKVEIAGAGGIVKTYTQDNLAEFLAEVPDAIKILTELGVPLS